MAKTKTKGKKPAGSAKAADPETPGGLSKAQRLDRVLADAEKRYGPGRVQRASETAGSYLLRRPTGILSLDLGLAGGFPAAAPSVIVGPDGAGKDYLLWLTAAECQRLYGDDFCCAIYFTEFKPDKQYMKDFCGFQVAFSEQEIEELNLIRITKGQPELTEDEIDHYRHQIGNVTFIYGVTAEEGFDTIFDLLQENICQFIAVNSLGYLQTEAKEKTEGFEEFAQRSSEATLLSKVMPQFSMYLNRGGPGGEPNETSLLLLNQVRANDAPVRAMPGRPPQEKDKYKAAVSAWALKHGKAIELFIHNGRRIYDEAGAAGSSFGSEKEKLVLGRFKQWELTKGKLGTHEGIKGELKYFYGEGVDKVGDLITVALRYGVLSQKGSWYVYDEGVEYDFKVNSLARAYEHLRGAPEAVEHLKARCYQEAGIPFRHV
jgi:hypothetical protein